MNAVIRFGDIHDATGLATLRWRSRSDDERRREEAGAFESRFAEWIGSALRSGDWHVAIAAVPGRLAGCMYLRRVETVPVPGVATRAWGYVTHAFVEDEYRNRGLGRAMLAEIIAQAKRLGLVELHVWPSQEAISLYRRMGFHSPEAQREADPPDEPSYVLPLSGKLR